MVDFACRACNADQASMLLDMGLVPLANAFCTNEADKADEFRAPLSLVMCKHCRLIQIRDLVPREQLFRSYLWVTGTSRAASDYAIKFANRLRERHLSERGKFLVEIASNDGFFLSRYRDAGFDILGVDPSDVALDADERGLPSIRDFFGRRVAESVLSKYGPADIIVARNVLGHSEELQDLLEGVVHLLSSRGCLVVELPYAFFIRNELLYDYIFHEHVSYMTVYSLSRLSERYGLKIIDITFSPLNGGSLVAEFVRTEESTPRADQSLLAFEDHISLNQPEGWAAFGQAVQAQRREFMDLLNELSRQEQKVVGYGASARCMTMLSYCGVTKSHLSAIGDTNPKKQGLLCPGSRIPVLSPDELMALQPDYVMIGAWNFKDEIMQMLRRKYSYSGKCIVPLPKPMVV